jgi:hypothetical protein
VTCAGVAGRGGAHRGDRQRAGVPLQAPRLVARVSLSLGLAAAGQAALQPGHQVPTLLTHAHMHTHACIYIHKYMRISFSLSHTHIHSLVHTPSSRNLPMIKGAYKSYVVVRN